MRVGLNSGDDELSVVSDTKSEVSEVEQIPQVVVESQRSVLYYAEALLIQLREIIDRVFLNSLISFQVTYV